MQKFPPSDEKPNPSRGVRTAVWLACVVLAIAGVWAIWSKRQLGATGAHSQVPGGTSALERGRALEQADSLEGAETCFRQVIEQSKSKGDTAMLAQGLLALAQLNLSLDLYQRAEPGLREALRLGTFLEGDHSDLHADAYLSLAECCEKMNQLAAADSAGDSAVVLAARALPSDPSFRVQVLLASSRVKLELRNAAAAEAQLREAMDLCEHSFSPLGLESSEARAMWGWSLVRLGRYTEAEPVLLRLYAGLYAALGVEHPLVRETAGYLAELYDRLQKPDLFGHYQSVARQGHLEEFGD